MGVVPLGNCRGGELSWWGVVLVGNRPIVGSRPGQGNCPGGSYPVGN